MSNTKTKSLTDFFSNEYQEYGKYTLQNRALPSIIDGFKPSARKIVHAALRSLSVSKPTKMMNLIGDIYKMSAYHHGETSLSSTIVGTLSSKYTDSLAPLTIIGSGGELRNRASAAPRYLSVQLSKYARLLSQDTEILEYNYDGEDRIEPKFYLPLIPTVLAKRDQGMALGYSYSFNMSINPVDLVDACIELVKTKQLKKTVLVPYIDGYNGEYRKIPDGRIWAAARYEMLDDKVIYTELMPSETFYSFETHLNEQIEKGNIIDWENESEDDDIKYIVHINPTNLQKLIKQNKHWSVLKLGEYFRKPTLNYLDENSKVISFTNIEDVVKYFVKFRLSKYAELKAAKIAVITTKINKANMLKRFIDLYLSDDIKLQKVAIKDVKLQLDTFNIEYFVLQSAISKLTKEEYDRLVKEIIELEKLRKYFEITTTETLYLGDLKSFRKDIAKDFPAQQYVYLHEYSN